jgi:hypothetical protein
VKNNDVRHDPLENLADVLAEDILNTPDDELLREVEEDYGDPRALANKFDQLLEGAEKQARSAASPHQARSSVLDLLYRLLEWPSTLFGGGPGRSGTQFQLFSVNRMVWAGAAAVLIVLILALAVFRSVSKFDERSTQLAALEKEQLAGSEQLAAKEKELLAGSEQLAAKEKELLAGSEQLAAKEKELLAISERLAAQEKALLARSERLAAEEKARSERLALLPRSERPTAPRAFVNPPTLKLSDEAIAALVAAGRKLIVAGDIPKARLVLQEAAEAGNATAALELGATYDPNILRTLKAPDVWVGVIATPMTDMAMADIRMARLWYEKAKDLGSTEAAGRLERLRSAPNPRR